MAFSGGFVLGLLCSVDRLFTIVGYCRVVHEASLLALSLGLTGIFSTGAKVQREKEKERERII